MTDTPLGHRQREALLIALRTGGLVAGKGGDTTHAIADSLTQRGLIYHGQRNYKVLTDEGLKVAANIDQAPDPTS